MARRYSFILCLLALLSGGRAQTGPTLFAPVPLAPTPADGGALIVGEESARRALGLGFAAAAAAQAQRLFDRAAPGSAARDAAALILCTARLELGDAAGAARALAGHGDAGAPAHRLRAGLIAAREARWPAAQVELAALRPELLPAEERAWFWLLQGMTAEGLRDPARAGEAYAKLAEVIIRALHRRVWVRFCETHGRIPGAETAVLAASPASFHPSNETTSTRRRKSDDSVKFPALSLLSRRPDGV
jgi:hypothetical protein